MGVELGYVNTRLAPLGIHIALLRPISILVRSATTMPALGGWFFHVILPGKLQLSVYTLDSSGAVRNKQPLQSVRFLRVCERESKQAKS